MNGGSPRELGSNRPALELDDCYSYSFETLNKRLIVSEE